MTRHECIGPAASLWANAFTGNTLNGSRYFQLFIQLCFGERDLRMC